MSKEMCHLKYHSWEWKLIKIIILMLSRISDIRNKKWGDKSKF